MKFNRHYDLEGKHAFLGASRYHWVNYSPEKLDATYRNAQAAMRGTELHEFASNAIRLGLKLQGRTTLSLYVNDAIRYVMTSEVILFYSENCFATADAICFRDKTLRIHDLKTGTSRASFKQLLIYAALFCLEYKVKPGEITTELRIYQEDEIQVFLPQPEDIAFVIDKIITYDKRIKRIREEDML